MGDKKDNYRFWKWAGGTLCILLIIVGGTAWYLSVKWKPIITTKLKTAVYNKSRHLYRLEFKDVSINLLTGSAALHEVSLVPDTAVYRQLKVAELAPANIFQLKLKKLQISRLGILTAWFKKEITMNAIILENPSINMIHYQVRKKKDKDTADLYKMIAEQFRSLHIKTIRVVNADFDYIDGATSKKRNSVKHLNLYIDDFLVDSLSHSDTLRSYYAKDIRFELTGYRSLSKDKMYTMKVDSIKGSVKGKTVTVTGFQMIPMYPELEFSRKYTYGKDRYDLIFNKISFTGLDFARLDTDGSLHAQALKLGPAKVDIFVNRELPPPPNLDKVRNFPHLALKRLPIPAIMDTVKLENIDLAYTEYNPISQKKGTVYFQNIKGNIVNVSNDSLQLSKNNHAIAHLSALAMKTSRIDVRIDFNLTAKNAAFSYSGHVGPMNLKVLNPMARNTGLVEIESGQMQKADFNIDANASGSSGQVNFYYTGLKIKLLKEGEDGMPVKKKGFLSFLANELLIKDANPSKGEPARSAKIRFQRTPAASFFNLMWKSFFIGMREIVGIGAVPVKTPEEAMEKVKDKKQERLKKKGE
ncbi:hypothetical protein ABIE26_004671 [Pedobacter africanus]|uniref:Uncharacterized protein n=1 Tax=Pedobacter africanus TaxID=151894 RepID=A0ACC6L2I3_9SPHI|nr:hypothetical protein [Pedobacter africanus]MDR6785860.1 hypothetical protein [Pedobacter africanus]